MSHEKLYRKELVDELRRIEVLIRKEKSIDKKAFYFSAGYGITGRIHKQSFSPDILLTDLVLQASYQILIERINALKRGDTVVPIENLRFDNICDGLRDLATAMEKKQNIQEPLEKILTSAYVASGAGSYLLEKGQIKL